MKKIAINWKKIFQSSQKSQSILLIIWCVLALVLLAAVFSLGTRPVGGEEKIVTIQDGQSRTSIASFLKENNIVRSKMHFLLLAHITGAQMKPGVYSLDPKQSSYSILHALRIGQFSLTKITVPEGWRREQIAKLLTDEGHDGKTFLEETSELEGFLFPDTYFLKKDASIKDIVNQFKETYELKTKDLKPTREQLILASIVERESSGDSDRALIAGIYTNRIKLGKSLEADPTVQFGKYNNALTAGTPLDVFWPTITMEDYRSVESPYNTYLIPAYPPGPICNPGAESMKAAINPTSTDDLFFFHTGDGQIITSKTYEEHRAKVQRLL